MGDDPLTFEEKVVRALGVTIAVLLSLCITAALAILLGSLIRAGLGQ